MQRPGKTHQAGPMDGPDRIDTWTLIKMFQQAKENTEGDASYYFEHLEHYFRNYNPKKGVDHANKILRL